ncbi:HEPN domain-containing protein [candidate division KSB1 bacterium]|nr:HEPN domain-containing protein [bacterium]NUM67722.1 HEPN domain-containing protein [candidate division KSB1 bacterium]
MDREKRVKSIRNWIAGADYDLDTAKHMLKTGRYLYVVFMCHLTLEKALKAHVELHEDKFPPKIHDLVRLADRAGLIIPEDLNRIVLELNQASIPTRYPEDLQQSLTVYTNDYAAKVLQETEEVLQWLKAHPRIAML